MPLKSYDQQLPDPPPDASLWRFMPLNFFQDFMANEELYLRRCDLYRKDDPQDGIPTDDFVESSSDYRSTVLKMRSPSFPIKAPTGCSRRCIT